MNERMITGEGDSTVSSPQTATMPSLWETRLQMHECAATQISCVSSNFSGRWTTPCKTLLRRNAGKQNWQQLHKQHRQQLLQQHHRQHLQRRSAGGGIHRRGARLLQRQHLSGTRWKPLQQLAADGMPPLVWAEQQPPHQGGETAGMTPHLSWVAMQHQGGAARRPARRQMAGPRSRGRAGTRRQPTWGQVPHPWWGKASHPASSQAPPPPPPRAWRRRPRPRCSASRRRCP
mmetsp:Transcript_27526/g.70084  ORF Transcript_27526/g.70084 Transcript_27526/m.70084 type:complete len:232 (+) Transcript_27526:344-1039(+)